MNARTIADEARDLYDLATLLALDVASQYVVSRSGDATVVSCTANARGAAKRLVDVLSSSEIAGIELPERQKDASGCGELVDAMLADEGLRSQMRLANLDAIEDVLDEVGAGQEFYSALEDMRADAAGK